MQWNIQPYEGNAAIRTWMNLEDVMIGEKSQPHKILHDLTYTWDLNGQIHRNREWQFPRAGRGRVEMGDRDQRVQNFLMQDE